MFYGYFHFGRVLVVLNMSTQHDKNLIYPLIKDAFDGLFEEVEFEEHFEPDAGLRMRGVRNGHVFSYDFVLEDFGNLHLVGKFDEVVKTIRLNLEAD